VARCADEDSVVAKKSKSKFDPEAFLGKADGGVTIAKYGRGQVVFSQGEPADSIFYIREGRVKIAVVSAQGKEAVVAFLKARDFIGEGCLTGRPRRVSTARAVEDSVITRVDKASMVRMLREEPNFSELFTMYILARTIRVEEDLVDQLFNSSEKRLARALLLLANFGKDGKQEPVIAKVSQETLGHATAPLSRFGATSRHHHLNPAEAHGGAGGGEERSHQAYCPSPPQTLSWREKSKLLLRRTRDDLSSIDVGRIASPQSLILHAAHGRASTGPAAFLPRCPTA
jgi:CRP/FNR family cyclic AMP-dependent transcriptional regulator